MAIFGGHVKHTFSTGYQCHFGLGRFFVAGAGTCIEQGGLSNSISALDSLDAISTDTLPTSGDYQILTNIPRNKIEMWC